MTACNVAQEELLGSYAPRVLQPLVNSVRRFPATADSSSSSTEVGNFKDQLKSSALVALVRLGCSVDKVQPYLSSFGSVVGTFYE